MNRRAARLGAALLLALLAGCSSGLTSLTLVSSGDHRFETGTRLPGDVLVRAGSAAFEPGAAIDGSVYVIGGRVMLDGTVGGNVVVLDGRVTLGPTAAVGGDLRVAEGTVERADTAAVAGQTLTGVLALPIEDVEATAGGGWLRGAVGALLLAAAGGLLARWRPRPLEHLGSAAAGSWVLAGAMGLLAALVLPFLLVVMAFTVVLIPLVIVLGMLLLLLLAYGWIALGLQLGAAVGRWLGRPLPRGWAAFGGTLALLLAFGLPVVGPVLVGLSAALILGAALLTRAGAHPYVPAAAPADDLDSYRRPSP